MFPEEAGGKSPLPPVDALKVNLKNLAASLDWLHRSFDICIDQVCWTFGPWFRHLEHTIV
ncbi:hypothetical protein AGMMS49944_26250 [Spirochaetia bacterium]|nr:hypothetical protein AGMMS49944_26250 [Spirochaetia bacterium]